MKSLFIIYKYIGYDRSSEQAPRDLKGDFERVIKSSNDKMVNKFNEASLEDTQFERILLWCDDFLEREG